MVLCKESVEFEKVIIYFLMSKERGAVIRGGAIFGGKMVIVLNLKFGFKIGSLKVFLQGKYKVGAGDVLGNNIHSL